MPATAWKEQCKTAALEFESIQNAAYGNTPIQFRTTITVQERKRTHLRMKKFWDFSDNFFVIPPYVFQKIFPKSIYQRRLNAGLLQTAYNVSKSPFIKFSVFWQFFRKNQKKISIVFAIKNVIIPVFNRKNHNFPETIYPCGHLSFTSGADLGRFRLVVLFLVSDKVGTRFKKQRIFKIAIYYVWQILWQGKSLAKLLPSIHVYERTIELWTVIWCQKNENLRFLFLRSSSTSITTAKD